MTHPSDVAVCAWGPVTVRVAWSLVAHGVKIKPEVLRDARDHVWLHLSEDTPGHVAEDRAETLTAAFVARARGKSWQPRFVEDADMELPQHWRDRLHRGLSKVAEWVLRLHIADGHPLTLVAERVGEDLLTVEAALEGLREVLRQTARLDGEDLESWDEARLDHLLHRLAVMPPAHEPPLLEVVDGLHHEHMTACIRSTRAYHLVRMGALKRADLVPPHGEARPTDRVRALVLHFHPDARQHRDAVTRELGVKTFPMADDLLMVDVSDPQPALEVLRLAAEVGKPSRDHVRGALLEGPGRWSKHGLIGPLVDEAKDAVRSVPWGTLDDLDELPAPLPAPPSARWAWASVAAMALLTAGVIQVAFAPDPPPIDHPLQVQVTPARSGWWLEFDVDDEAYVFVVRQEEGELAVVLDSTHIKDKVAHATGDGAYRLHTVGDGVLVASASHPLPALDTLTHEARSTEAPLAELAAAIRAVDPKADVKVAR